MATVDQNKSPELRQQIEALFQRSSPVLVEVRFLNMATSPDWFLIDEEDELDPILDRLQAGVEIYLHSVWDMKNTKEALRIRK